LESLTNGIHLALFQKQFIASGRGVNASPEEARFTFPILAKDAEHIGLTSADSQLVLEDVLTRRPQTEKALEYLDPP